MTIDSTGTYATGVTDLSYSVADASSYTLSLSSSNASASMTATTAGIADTISSIATDMSLDSFNNNTWGYCLGIFGCSSSDIFKPIRTNANADIIDQQDNLSNQSSGVIFTKITFGAKINLELTPATYTNTQVISLVAEDIPTGLHTVSYMQDLTTQLCADTRTPSASETTSVETKQLVDRRDGKKYWVAKLADGHCWMTQNLALDLSTSKALTPADSNVSSNWTPPANTTSTGNTGITDHGSVQSWSWGEYIINYPNSGENRCFNQNYSNSNLQSCERFSELTNVGSGTGYMDDFRATGSGGGILAVDGSNKKYDAHYLLGNFYTYNAAVAGTGGELTRASASSSICPKGWRLPSGNSTASGSYTYLLRSVYGRSNGQNAAPAPLYFNYAGMVWPESNRGINYVGYYGRYWSDAAYRYRNQAYFFGMLDNSFNPDFYNGKVNGMSVRCLI